MKSIYASKQIASTIWTDFIAHFKSETTRGSYESDIDEIMDFFKKDFLQIRDREAKKYFLELESRVKDGQLKSGTMAKKFRELHSFAAYICENRERYGIKEAYTDVYEPYLKLVAKQEKYVHSIPAEHMDRLLEAAEDQIAAYCMITMLYRLGLTSTELIELRPEDFGLYDNGMYVQIRDRREAVYVPEDVSEILQDYLNVRQESDYLFYNRQGNPLNTMYISRMLKKYTQEAGIPAYSAQSIRNTCGVTLYAYGAKSEQVALQLGRTETQIRRYHNIRYREEMMRQASDLVRIKILPPQK